VSPELRKLIFDQKNQGLSSSKIANFCKVSVRTVQRTIKNFAIYEDFNDRPRSGRPKRLSERDIRHLRTDIQQDRRQTLSEIKENVNLFTRNPISTSTIRRAMKEELNMSSRIAAKKPFLKPQHRIARLKWANDYAQYPMKEWQHVIWSDESSIELGKWSKVCRVWRKTHERYEESCIYPTFKSGRSSLMIWACIAYNYKGPMVILPKGERKGEHYVQNVLEPVFWDFYMDMTEKLGVVLMMEDGAPIHRSGVAKEWKIINEINIFPHPAQSPDLNPIEHVWKLLKIRINNRKEIPKNEDELRVAIVEEWDKIDISEINAIVESMPERCKALIKARGGPTRY
jgi:transposase